MLPHVCQAALPYISSRVPGVGQLIVSSVRPHSTQDADSVWGACLLTNFISDAEVMLNPGSGGAGSTQAASSAR